MWSFDAQIDGTMQDISTGFEGEIVTRADAVETAQAWLSFLSDREKKTAAIWIREYDDDTGAPKELGEEIKEDTNAHRTN